MLRQFSVQKSQRTDQLKTHRQQRKEARQITPKNPPWEINSFSSRSSSRFSRQWFHQILMLIRLRSLTWCETEKVTPQQWSRLSWSLQQASKKTQTIMTSISSSARSPSATHCHHSMRTLSGEVPPRWRASRENNLKITPTTANHWVESTEQHVIQHKWASLMSWCSPRIPVLRRIRHNMEIIAKSKSRYRSNEAIVTKDLALQTQAQPPIRAPCAKETSAFANSSQRWTIATKAFHLKRTQEPAHCERDPSPKEAKT